jgi:CheY-like chemotaxis protein
MACGGCILVVDDEPDIREVVREFLESLGCKVVLAVDGLDALDCLARGPMPCMILLDLMMPRLDGAVLARQLREHPHLRSVPIVSMSASGRTLTPPLVVKHLDKPFCLDAVAAPIARYCRRSPSIL